MTTEHINNILACPQCGGQLTVEENATCTTCETTYPRHGSNGYNFHLQSPKQHVQRTLLGTDDMPGDEFFSPLVFNPYCEIDVQSLGETRHLFPTLTSYIPKPKKPISIALDIGCGKGQNKAVCEKLGYHYLGLDYREQDATILGDAQALPFLDNSIDFALSMAVLEHIPHPQVMIQEAFRVLKHGSVFLGSVAFMQPFHDNSYFHFSHLGMYKALQDAGFEVIAVAPSQEYSVLIANGRQLFRKMNRNLVRTIMAPTISLHKMWWKMNPIAPNNPNLSEIRRLQKFSGAQHFVALKPFSKG